MTIKDLRDKRNKLLGDAQAILLAEPDSEKRASAHKQIADADLVEIDITALEALEARNAEERKKTAPPRGAIGDAANGSVEERTAKEKVAFRNYICKGIVDQSVLVEGRDLTTSSYGQLIPQAFYPVLTEAKRFYGNVLNDITILETDDGAPTKYATINDTGNLLAIVGEDTTIPEVDPTSVGGAIISSDFLTTGIIKVSLAQLQDSSFDLDAWIKKSFGLRYYRGLSNMVTNGSSSGNIGPLKTTAGKVSAAVGWTTGSTTAIAWADIVGLFAALDPAYAADSKWEMNSTTRGALLGTTDTLGRPLYVPAVTAESFDMILGRPVTINQFLDAPTGGLYGAYPILFGDMTAYLLRTVRPGLSVMRLNERFIDAGMIGFIGFARAGGSLLKAGIDPVLSMFMS